MTDPQSHFNTIPPIVRELILDAVREHGLTVAALLSDSRARHISQPRQALYSAIYAVTWPNGAKRYSMPQVARFLGRTDHTTVWHGIRAHEGRMRVAA